MQFLYDVAELIGVLGIQVSNNPAGIANDQCAGGNIPRHHGTRANERVLADR